jgi:hypothetical protein
VTTFSAPPDITMVREVPTPETVAGRRALLADLLTEAAEIEHTVMAMYLFAAFALKVSPDEGGVSYRQLELIRRWKGTLLEVAREEMEHLGIVCNILTAIGEAPLIRARSASIAASRPPWVTGPFGLGRLSADRVLAFLCLEMPAALDPADQETLSGWIPGFDPSRYDGLYRLYTEIHGLLTGLPEELLFVGPPSAQTSTSDVWPAQIRGIDLTGKPAYNVTLAPVTDQASALAAVELIIEQGEGAVVGDPNSHFEAILGIFRDLVTELDAQPDFAPSRPVARNPTRSGAGRGTTVGDPTTLAAMQLFDDAFAVLVELLSSFLGHADLTEDQVTALQRAAFMPMMTTVIRPLGELLTLLPCETGGAERAGPSFDLPRRGSLLPHPAAAWGVIHVELESVRDQADALRQDAELPPELRARLQMMWENLVRIAGDFALNMQIPVQESGLAP